MFKHIQIFSIDRNWAMTPEEVEAALAAAPFAECGASQERSIGWVPPRGEEHGPLLESVDGQWIMKLMIESKSVPAAVVKEKTGKRADEIEASTGRKPGKRERRDIADEIRAGLLSAAFPKKSTCIVWIDRAASRLIVEGGSSSKTDEVVTALVKALNGFSIWLLQTELAPVSLMTTWLDTQEPEPGFSIDRDCKLTANDESKASVRYTKHPLDIEEIRAHIAAGKSPVHLAMTWNERVSFVLQENGCIKNLSILDVVLEEGTAQDKESSFDADVAIVTGELRKMIPDLLDALGGERKPAEMQQQAA